MISSLIFLPTKPQHRKLNLLGVANRVIKEVEARVVAGSRDKERELGIVLALVGE